LAPACIAVLAIVLNELGAPAAVNALICALALVPYVYDRLRLLEEERRGRALERDPYHRFGPSLEDWATLLISGIFCIAGVVLLRDATDWRDGVVTLAFFGACALVIGTIVVRKRRRRKFRALRVSIEGSRNIVVSDAALMSLAAGMLTVGGIMFFVGAHYPVLFRAIGAFIALVGGVLVVLRASGLFRSQFLRFEPRGLVVGQQSFEFLLPWDNVRAIASFEVHDNPFVRMAVHDLNDIEVRPLRARRKAQRYLSRNGGVLIMPWMFGLEEAPLLAALERYVRDSGARQELAPRSAIKALPAA
jgi:hypothetical protein